MSAICKEVEFAKVSDAVEISKLSRKYIEYGLRQVYTPRRIRALIRSSSKNVVVVREQFAVVAVGIMTYRRDTANLDLLAVAKSCRRRGLGMQVVQWLEKVAVTAGIAHIFVQVRKSNSGAIRFYETLGFHIVDEADGYYQGRESAVIMCIGVRQMFGVDRDFGAR